METSTYQSKNSAIDETHSDIIGMVGSFCEKYIRPNIMLWDRDQIFPREIFRKMGELGFLSVLAPPEYGGAGLGYAVYVRIIEEISRVCGSVGLSYAALNSLSTNHILMFGTEEQKQRWLPRLCSGAWIGAWALTEANTGSDALGMDTTAYLDGDDYVLNGSKNWITHGESSDVAVVMVRTGEKGDSHGISAIVVEKGTPGFRSGKKEDKLGMRASETSALHFDECRVPKGNLLGNEGDGFRQAMSILDGGRISIAALSNGIAVGAFEAARDYSKVRVQFGQPICNFQAIAFKLATMATQINAARLLTRNAALRKDGGHRITGDSAMAKFFASEVAVSTANEAVQIFGGYGYTKEYPAEKFFRDAKLCTIGEGTSEIQQLVISRELLKNEIWKI